MRVPGPRPRPTESETRAGPAACALTSPPGGCARKARGPLGQGLPSRVPGVSLICMIAVLFMSPVWPGPHQRSDELRADARRASSQAPSSAHPELQPEAALSATQPPPSGGAAGHLGDPAPRVAGAKAPEQGRPNASARTAGLREWAQPSHPCPPSPPGRQGAGQVPRARASGPAGTGQCAARWSRSAAGRGAGPSAL